MNVNYIIFQRTELRTLRTEDGKVETVRVHPLVPRWPEEYVDGQYSVSNEVSNPYLISDLINVLYLIKGGCSGHFLVGFYAQYLY